MKSERSRYSGYRFPPEIISYAVWAYHRFCLRFRDVEDLLAERGIIVSCETIRRWCQKFGHVVRVRRTNERLLWRDKCYSTTTHLQPTIDTLRITEVPTGAATEPPLHEEGEERS